MSEAAIRWARQLPEHRCTFGADLRCEVCDREAHWWAGILVTDVVDDEGRIVAVQGPQEYAPRVEGVIRPREAAPGRQEATDRPGSYTYG